MTTAAERMNHYLDQATGSVSLIAAHEADAFRGFRHALVERFAVARRARSISELVRDQADLLPETWSRFVRNHAVRRELWRGLVKDFASPSHKIT